MRISSIKAGASNNLTRCRGVRVRHSMIPPGARSMCPIHGIALGTRGLPVPRKRTPCRESVGIACGSMCFRQRRDRKSCEPLLPAVRWRVANVADVWLNGSPSQVSTPVLSRASGSMLRPRSRRKGADNFLVVESRQQPVPAGAGSTTESVIPLSGDFFVFGGIYRSVELITVDSAHVDMLDYGGSGVYAHGDRPSRRNAATVQVTSSSRVNDSAEAGSKCQVETHDQGRRAAR